MNQDGSLTYSQEMATAHNQPTSHAYTKYFKKKKFALEKATKAQKGRVEV
jgi:hypothetical protein